MTTQDLSKRFAYSAAEKLEIIAYALRNNQIKASFKFGVHKSMVSRWIRDHRKIYMANPDSKRIGSGRQASYSPVLVQSNSLDDSRTTTSFDSSRTNSMDENRNSSSSSTVIDNSQSGSSSGTNGKPSSIRYLLNPA
jgi:transposase-like protein